MDFDYFSCSLFHEQVVSNGQSTAGGKGDLQNWSTNLCN